MKFLIKMTLLIFISFACFISFISSSTIIKLPFKREIISPSNSENFGKELMSDNIASVEVSLGTPAQHLRLNLQTKEICTVALSEKPNVISKSPRFHHNQSSTFFFEEQEHGFIGSEAGIYAQGEKSNDTFTIGGYEIKGFEFMLSLWTSSPKSLYANSGVLGLGIKKRPELDKVNIISQLVKSNIVDAPVFTFQYTEKDNGLFIIGGYPHEYDNEHFQEDKLVKVPVDRTFGGSWDIGFDNVTFGSEELSDPTKKKALIVFEYAYIKGTAFFHKVMLDTFFNKAIEKNFCFKNTTKGNYYYYCINDKSKLEFEKIPELKFIINKTITFTFSSEELFKEVEGKLVYQIVFDQNVKGYQGIWQFGLPFLKKYQTTFDREELVYGFYPKSVKMGESIVGNFTSFSVFIGLFAVFSIFFGMCVVFFLKKELKCKKERKRRANEIEDNYNYTPMEEEL